MLRYSWIVFLMVLVACSGDGDKGGSKGNPAKKGGPRGNREVAVEIYLASVNDQAREYETMATLLPMEQVSLAAKASGQLVSLTAKDGAKVAKGALLAKIDDSELKAELKQAESDLQLAKQKRDRIQALVEKNAATQEDLESVEAGFRSAEAKVELVKAQIEKTEVRAPFGGRLGLVDLSVGAWVTTGAKIVELSEVNRLKARFALPQRFASQVKVGDKISVLDQERNLEKVGKVKALDATISESSRTRQVLVEVSNSDGQWIAGGYAKVKVPLREGNGAVMSIPAEALILDKDGAYVFVKKDGAAIVKHVETGLRTPISVDVKSGLKAGDSVVVSGLMSMREGVKLRVKEVRRPMDYEVGK